ncbi:MAG: phosphoribosylformylglycinamidine synthase, partial [Gammaproteobacteria bacterium]|nr:phosphoribosylformylglycinamidine synthase [Gammaproteobacteria bacterium]
YHDRSDGGAIVTLLEMAFASRCSLDLDIGPVEDPLGMLFSEELGAVLEVPTSALASVQDAFASSGLAECLHMLGSPTPGGDTFRISAGGSLLIDSARSRLHKVWSELSCAMQTRRDNPLCAAEEHERLADLSDPGLHAVFDFDLRVNPATRSILSGARPTIAVLREQGVNGHMEMAAAFDRAGFAAIDVTMSDLYAGRRDLADFTGFVACGGFSFGDVLGAGMGWAKSILFDARMRDMFREFFERPDSFALGVCNGCQMMAGLKSLIPGAEDWPDFTANLSGQFESRMVMTEILDSESMFFSGMQGARLPVVVAHGEGRASFSDPQAIERLGRAGQISLRFVDNAGLAMERYPYNPNGSPDGITGLSAADGRVTIMMPHPERLFRTVTNSWYPKEWGEHGPWLRMFQNARAFVG